MDSRERYTWFLLEAGGWPRADVVIQDICAGAWEKDPKGLPLTVPIGFWVVSPGATGPVVSTSSGTLVSARLAGAISSLCADDVRVFPAIVAHPRDLVPPVPCALLRPLFGISIAQFADAERPGGIARIGYVRESPEDVVANAPLRAALESLAIPDLEFAEPKFG
jgi:hypothetical protein